VSNTYKKEDEMANWTQLASPEDVEKTKQALESHNISVFVVASGADAKKKVFEILPKGAQVLPMTSMTLDSIGVSGELQESTEYLSVRKQLASMNRETEGSEMQKLGAAPDWTIGSVHAITHAGEVIIASNTGSQLPAYVYGAAHVIWVAGTHKVVATLDDAMRRIYEHSLPLESERAKKAYGVAASAVNKMAIVKHENIKGRITLVLVNEVLGF
jgi:hypothetical protein